MVFNNLCLIFMLVFVSLNVFSQEKIEDLPREKSKNLGKWEVVPTVKSVEDKAMRNHRGKKNYVRRNRIKNQPLLKIENEDEAQVVYNPDRKSVGTVNGTVIVNLNNSADEKELLRDFPIRKIRLEKKIRIGFYKIKAGNDIDTVVENLKKDPRVKSVEVEVLSNNGGIKPL